MKKVEIQHTDLQIAPINFGGNVFGWTLNEQQSFEMLDKFVGAGFNFIDTADTYSWWVNGTGGQSEEIIGKWLKSRGNRQNIVIATKVGSETKEHGYDISRKHILKSADESLRRLGVDHIDLYYTHFDDNITPVEETLSAYADLIEAGKVRYIAASNLSPARLTESFDVAEKNGLPKYVALQPHYNLVERAGFETDYAGLVEKYGLSVFPYWSLAAGFLTGKYRTETDFDKTARGGGIKKYFDAKGKAVLKALDAISEKHETKQATVALAWLLAKPLITAPIVSATSERQLDTLCAAPALKLDTEDIELLNEVSN
ncbi:MULTISPECIES: aldo/keto reductase [Sphingobacterium]|jgi:aryl-alcohol dehydrogenase-like predicted oxidoreductase|uniref:Alcohol dehydrogenase n=1 Tax=Sphingobacterium multivorum TaxID=28454 RepID=A0A654DL77_SPHMU|nr:MULTISPECIES: aldo/keto reductase [Sphingobacterium]HAF37104.1 aldo/keto reductase [Sphingobacterium sp.]MDF2850495.1 alcohol dehydrogenase [Sphingobacterium multivorum]OFV20789.1 alcohol dehydrogenase [Sphingobacterium sp. HMSC13C05]OJZ01159.1 MAG: alcohol dehydrogenase [Sphingobacterium sp. 40-24]QQT45984.1 aldo/keto reductase [Sphingobacterium multivorum]